MSREIKYRVFAKGVKKMLYFDNPGLVMCNFDEGPGYGMGLRLVGGHAYFGEYSDLMQSTGTHDCKGKEIYTGDIVKADFNDLGIVKLGEHSGENKEAINLGFYISWDNELARSLIRNELLYFIKKVDVTVIGNIYDNPELLGGADDAERTNFGR